MEPDEREKRPRLSVDISQELQDKLRREIPWGLMSHVFRKMAEGLLELLERAGPGKRDIVTAAFISGDITVLDLLRVVTQKGQSNESARPEEKLT